MTNSKEAKARIKINKLLEESGWRFEDSEKGKANIQLEPGIKLSELGKDFRSVIYKDSRDSWQNASIVVSTIQTFLAGDRYKKEFSPTDFELVISDEAHRSIGGNSRAVFEYFVGYKLGLTATPKNYLKGVDPEGTDSQREYERRLLLDTYKTFGCKPGEPTFTYSLPEGVKDGFLINPIIVDARTEITTELLSEEGYAVYTTTDEGQNIDGVFNERHYERKFFNEETNIAMCKAFIDHGHFDSVAKNMEFRFLENQLFFVSRKNTPRVLPIFSTSWLLINGRNNMVNLILLCRLLHKCKVPSR